MPTGRAFFTAASSVTGQSTWIVPRFPSGGTDVPKVKPTYESDSEAPPFVTTTNRGVAATAGASIASATSKTRRAEPRNMDRDNTTGRGETGDAVRSPIGTTPHLTKLPVVQLLLEPSFRARSSAFQLRLGSSLSHSACVCSGLHRFQHERPHRHKSSTSGSGFASGLVLPNVARPRRRTVRKLSVTIAWCRRTATRTSTSSLDDG